MYIQQIFQRYTGQMKYKDLLIVLNKYLENWALATFHVEPDASQWFFHKEVLMHREWHCCEEIFLGILNVKFQPSIQLRQPILKIHIYYWIPNTILNKFWKKNQNYMKNISSLQPKAIWFNLLSTRVVN